MTKFARPFFARPQIPVAARPRGVARAVAVALVGIAGLPAVPGLPGSGAVGTAVAQIAPSTQELAEQITPPRLVLVEGPVSLRRPGGLGGGDPGDGWVAAQRNLPLAVGDTLRVDGEGLVELQFGPQSWLRIAAHSQVTLTDQAPDFVAFRLEAGQVYLDLRALAAGQGASVEVPGAMVTIDRAGAYRFDIGQAQGAGAQQSARDLMQNTPQNTPQTTLLARRGGRMTIALADGQTRTLVSGQEGLVGAQGRIELFAARSPDGWDRWNERRGDEVLGMADSGSRRYLPDGVYGAEELDRYGAWQANQEYGPVWIPNDMPRDWAPYSAGQWVNDPAYGWTWVDQALWGWAPFHYGRWVQFNDRWAWAPGPRTRRAVYAPALVGLTRVPHVDGRPHGPFGAGVGWTALGWGEPLRPWWGRPGFRGQPTWAGWGGPRVVAPVYQHQTHPNAVIAARPDSLRFGAHDLVRVPPTHVLPRVSPTHVLPRVSPPQAYAGQIAAEPLPTQRHRVPGQAFGTTGQSQVAPGQAFGAPAKVYGGHVPGAGVAAPALGSPAFGAPAFGASPPVFRAPAYQAPVNPAPVYQAPAYQAPAHQPPAFQAPRVHSLPALPMSPPPRAFGQAHGWAPPVSQPSMPAPVQAAPQVQMRQMAPPTANFRNGNIGAPTQHGAHQFRR